MDAFGILPVETRRPRRSAARLVPHHMFYSTSVLRGDDDVHQGRIVADGNQRATPNPGYRISAMSTRQSGFAARKSLGRHQLSPCTDRRYQR